MFNLPQIKYFHRSQLRVGVFVEHTNTHHKTKMFDVTYCTIIYFHIVNYIAVCGWWVQPQGAPPVPIIGIRKISQMARGHHWRNIWGLLLFSLTNPSSWQAIFIIIIIMLQIYSLQTHLVECSIPGTSSIHDRDRCASLEYTNRIYLICSWWAEHCWRTPTGTYCTDYAWTHWCFTCRKFQVWLWSNVEVERWLSIFLSYCRFLWYSWLSLDETRWNCWDDISFGYGSDITEDVNQSLLGIKCFIIFVVEKRSLSSVLFFILIRSTISLFSNRISDMGGKPFEKN